MHSIIIIFFISAWKTLLTETEILVSNKAAVTYAERVTSSETPPCEAKQWKSLWFIQKLWLKLISVHKSCTAKMGLHFLISNVLLISSKHKASSSQWSTVREKLPCLYLHSVVEKTAQLLEAAVVLLFSLQPSLCILYDLGVDEDERRWFDEGSQDKRCEPDE